MKILVDQSAANADAVAACYSGPEQDVWELVMGKQVREQRDPISIKDARRVKSKPWLPGLLLVCKAGETLPNFYKDCFMSR